MQYHKVDSYKKHISRHHVNVWHAPEPEIEMHDDEAEVVELDNISVNDLNLDAEPVEENDVDIQGNLSRSMCLLSLKLQEKHVIPRIVVNDVCTSVRNLMIECVENAGRVQHDHAPQNQEAANALFLQIIKNTFDDISSEHRLVQYCKKMLNMVTPCELVLGNTQDSVKETMQFVSILETIKEVLKNEDIVSHMLQFEEKQIPLKTSYLIILMEAYFRSILSSGLHQTFLNYGCIFIWMSLKL